MSVSCGLCRFEKPSRNPPKHSGKFATQSARPINAGIVIWFYCELFLKGDVSVNIPFFKIGAIQYLPGIRVGLTPFGYNYYLENMIVSNHNPLIATIGIGSATMELRPTYDYRFLPCGREAACNSELTWMHGGNRYWI